MRGKVSAHFFNIPEDESDNIVSFTDKMVFIMIYHQGEFVYRRLKKICEAFTSESM